MRVLTDKNPDEGVAAGRGGREPAGRALMHEAMVPPPGSRDPSALVLSALLQEVAALQNEGTRAAGREEQLEPRQTRQQLQQLTAAMPGAVYQLRRAADGTGELLFMSAVAHQLFDLPPGDSCTDLAALRRAVVASDRTRLAGAFAAAAGRPCCTEFRVRAKGGVRWLQLNAVPEAPQPDGSQLWAGLIVDITEVKWVQRALLRARDEWCATVDSVRDMILLEDSRGRILRCNLATAQFLGQPFQAVIGLDLRTALFGPGGEGAPPATFRAERATVQLPGCGDWFEIANFPLRAPARSGASWVHVIANVSERHRFEDEAKRLSAAIDQTHEMLLILGRNGTLQYANPAYCNAAGVSAAQILGEPVRRLPLAPRGTVRPIAAAVLAGQAWHGTFQAAGSDGSVRAIEATISPVRSEGGETASFVCVARDVTEPRRLEAIAEATNMVDQVGFIFATLRHELGNPVNSVKTALSVLQRNLADYSRDTVAEYLERSLAEISRMEYLLRAFKALGAFERPHIECVDAAACLEEFACLVRPDLDRRGIAFEMTVEPGLGAARIDRRSLNQVLLNLVTNAADAVASHASPRVRMAARVRGQRIEVRVEDNGVGIAPQDIGNLFRPFFSTKAGGTGLGLAIVRKLLSKMNSSVEVESERGAGTVFSLSLPAARESE